MTTNLFLAATLSAALLLALPRLFIGPTLYDRALALKTLLVRAALIAGAMAVAFGEATSVDVAFLLCIAALAIAIGVTKIFRSRSFQPAMVRPGEQ